MVIAGTPIIVHLEPFFVCPLAISSGHFHGKHATFIVHRAGGDISALLSR